MTLQQLVSFTPLRGTDRILTLVQSALLNTLTPVLTNLKSLAALWAVTGTFQTVTVRAAATDTVINHNLGTAAVGYLLAAQSAAGSVYLSPATQPTSKTLTIQASAPMTVTLFVYEVP